MTKRVRSFVLLAISGTVALLVLTARPENPLSGNGILVSATVFKTATPLEQPATTTATSSPLPTQSQTHPAVEAHSDPRISPTPLSFYASQLQTLAPTRNAPSSDNPSDGWNPPPLEVPIAHSPFDHYWLIRPVASNYTNSGLPHYPYGSGGPRSDLRIHHGVDLANPIGVEVSAAATGIVLWADKGHFNEYESITAYGNTVVIQHDFGYKGQSIYTLYAHLSVMLVNKGDRVETGQLIGLIGNTGQVSGPHVHFEVRIGRNSYFAVRNPVLWMAPYANTGVVAGRVVFASGEPAYDVPITLINLSTGRVVQRTSTYAGFGINADDHWNETFTIPDVSSGTYLVTSRYGAVTWSGTIEVLPGITNWVEMQRHDPEPPGDLGPAASPMP